MLYKLKHTFFLILCLGIVWGCQSKKQMTSLEKSEQYKARMNKKKKQAYKKSREEAREKHYNKQAASTKERWDLNKEKSEKWNKQEFHKKSLKYRFRKFFERFKRESKPDEGLFSKKQMRRKKGNIFQRIFKKKKKK